MSVHQPRLLAPEPFSVLDPLPTPGDPPLLLEASAGTGKTWTIGALVARYVATGTPLEEILVITFGRAASRELRERVRTHLRGVLAGLADPGTPTWGADPVVEALRADAATSRERLAAALADFDAATIATTHQFCQIVLSGLGVAGDSDPEARLVEDLSELRDEVVDDLYVRGFQSAPHAAFTREEAGRIARLVTEDPHAAIVPAGDLPGTDGRKLKFAHLVRDELARRKRRLGVLGFDDLLGDLAAALAADDGLAAQRMRRRWRVVLVDEFQDTDPVQWEIISRAFAGHAAVILIGDPKQAIYAFRGGDVDTYLQAADASGRLATLATNHRADAPVVTALGRLLTDVELGSPRIVAHEVAASCATRLAGPDGAAPPPVRLRFVPTDLVPNTGRGKAPGVADLRAFTARDVAAEAARLLRAGATFDGEPLRAGHLAVLSYRRAELWRVRAALAELGIPSVIAAEESIFETEAATDWLTLLEGLGATQRADKVRSAALTPFVGLTAAELAALDDAGAEELASRLQTWRELLDRRGIAAVVAAASAGGLEARVLAELGGERRLTDLRHLGEQLHQRATAEGEGLVGLTRWLREQMAAPRPGARTRRLDSDADAVHLSTIHSSKGLQYPIVLLPFLSDRHRPALSDDEKHTYRDLRFHDDTGRRCLDIGIDDPGRRDREEAYRREDDGESLRLLYVALTRAQSQVVLWWFGAQRNTPSAPLHRVLFGREPGVGGPVPVSAALPSPEGALATLRRWEEYGALSLEIVDGSPAPEPPPAPTPPELSVRRFERTVDQAWRRTSYTALSRPLDEARYEARLSEPAAAEDDDRFDETDVETGAETTEAAGVPVPMGTLPVGANFGSLVHEVLELTDPSGPDLRGALLARIEERAGRWGMQGVDADVLATGLEGVCTTPLGPLLPGATLASVGMNRLAEMAFDLPLAGGDRARPGDGALLGDLAALLREHLPADDPVGAFASSLEDPLLGAQALRGYLTGSVDVVLRHGERFVVVDYKTNWLAPPGDELTTAHYGPMQLRAAMGHSSYPLQALIYQVVLHRFLRWRLPAYDPERHLGGVLYLYVRGMIGPDAPVVDGHPAGVFSWRGPVALVDAVSDLLDGVVPGPLAEGRLL